MGKRVTAPSRKPGLLVVLEHKKKIPVGRGGGLVLEKKKRST